MGHLDSGVGDMFAIGYSLLRKVRVAPYAEEEVPQVMTEDLIVVVVEIEKEEAIGMVLVAVVVGCCLAKGAQMLVLVVDHLAMVEVLMKVLVQYCYFEMNSLCVRTF